MVQCEMCGAETSSPKTIKVEGAKLERVFGLHGLRH